MRFTRKNQSNNIHPKKIILKTPSIHQKKATLVDHCFVKAITIPPNTTWRASSVMVKVVRDATSPVYIPALHCTMIGSLPWKRRTYHKRLLKRNRYARDSFVLGVAIVYRCRGDATVLSIV